MLATYISGNDVTVTIPFIDADGVEYSADSAQYRVLDQYESAIVPLTSVTGFIAGSTEATITVLAANNAITGTTALPNGETMSNTSELRLVEVLIDTENGTIRFETAYVIELNNRLVEGKNSFQTYPDSLFRANDLNKLDAWNNADKKARCSAMVRAAENLKKITFKNVGKLATLTAAQFAALDVQVKEAIKNAQVIEADSLLSNNEVEDLINSGIMSMTVGEAKQFFRQTRPVNGVICARAMREISAYIEVSKSIGRA